jgi:hypothetical protein
MTKDHILAEVRRTAAANGGQPLGRERFLAATGIRESDWSGRYWVRWNDAIREAGFSPNSLNAPLDSKEILEQLTTLVRELGHFPVVAELKLKSRTDPTFPNFKTFDRFGSKAKRVAALSEFARLRGYQDVVDICERSKTLRVPTDDAATEDVAAGYVYLLRHGTAREFKIGRTNNPIRREGEIGIELPQQLGMRLAAAT